MEQLEAAKSNIDNSTPVGSLPYCAVRSHPSLPVPALNNPASDIDHDFYATAQITAVGIGSFGSKMAQLLSRNVRGITCHEVSLDGNSSNEAFSALLSTVLQSDLVFLIRGIDDPSCEPLAQEVGKACCRSGILTVAIAPPSQGSAFPQGQESWYDSLFVVSGRSLPAQPEPFIPEGDALTGYAIRHMVAAITNLITYQTGICIDFADVAAIMRSGNVGRVGVGVASGESRAVVAAKGAIRRLEEQGVSLAHATGVLVGVHGSSTLTMEEFDDASGIVHGCVAKDANIIVGLISDEPLGYNVKVTVIAVHEL